MSPASDGRGGDDHQHQHQHRMSSFVPPSQLGSAAGGERGSGAPVFSQIDLMDAAEDVAGEDTDVANDDSDVPQPRPPLHPARAGISHRQVCGPSQQLCRDSLSSLLQCLVVMVS